MDSILHEPVVPNMGFNGLKIIGYLVEMSSAKHSVEISWESKSSNTMHPRDFQIERMNSGMDFILNPRNDTRYAYIRIDSSFMGPSDEFMIIYKELDGSSYKAVIEYLFGEKRLPVLGNPPKKYLVIVDANIDAFDTLIATMKKYGLEYYTNVHEAFVDAFGQ